MTLQSRTRLVKVWETTPSERSFPTWRRDPVRWKPAPEPGMAGRAIGLFDSGLGGLTVAREVLRLMPGVPLVYLADTAHVPYGPRPASEIREFSRGIIGALADAGAGAILAACNMSSALALPTLEAEVPLPLVGTIRPGVAAALAVWEAGPLGVLATEGTCDSGAYPAEAQRRRPGIAVEQVACPDFVPLVEAGAVEGPDAEDAATRYMAPLLRAGCRTVILGCTHYPWLLPVLRDVAGASVRFVDPARAAVEAMARLWTPPLAREGAPEDAVPHRFAATAEAERLAWGVERWLGLRVSAEEWPLWRAAPALSQ